MRRKSTRPHEKIPNTYAHVPYGDASPFGATLAELKAAGFHGGGEAAERKPGTPPASELLVPGHELWVNAEQAASILSESTFAVLRDEDGWILATWDEGRWWTREDSDAFTRAVADELLRRGRLPW